MLDNEELFEFQKILKHGGFKTYQNAFFDSDNYKTLRAFLLDNLPKANVNYPNIHFCSIAKVKEIGKIVIDKHTNGVDIKVPYSFQDELGTALIEKFGMNPNGNQLNDIIAFIKNNIELKDVTDIPLFSDISDEQNAFVSYPRFYNIFTSLNYFEQLPNILTSIELKGEVNDFSKGMYVHEMYHALSKRNKGYTDNYLYDETLSIFMEKVTALDIDESLIIPANLRRLILVKDNIIHLTLNDFYEESYRSIIEPQKYILSSLLATSLFNTYLHSTNKGRREIDNEINKVLTGNQILEDVLQKYEATPEKGVSLVKMQTKKYTK